MLIKIRSSLTRVLFSSCSSYDDIMKDSGKLNHFLHEHDDNAVINFIHISLDFINQVILIQSKLNKTI